MRLRLSLTLDIEPREKPADEYREVDIPGTQTERLPDLFGEDAQDGRRIGFQRKPIRSTSTGDES